MSKAQTKVLSKFPTAVCRNHGVYCILVPGSFGIAYGNTVASAWQAAAKSV